MREDGTALHIIDSYGEQITRDMLPPATQLRWVSRRKAQVVCAIRGGLISRQEARDLYGISDDELLSWEKLLDELGPAGLRASSKQRYLRTRDFCEPKTSAENELERFR